MTIVTLSCLRGLRRKVTDYEDQVPAGWKFAG